MDEAGKKERSQLLNKQNAERKELEKDVKKKKGALKARKGRRLQPGP